MPWLIALLKPLADWLVPMFVKEIFGNLATWISSIIADREEKAKEAKEEKAASDKYEKVVQDPNATRDERKDAEKDIFNY